MKKKYKIKIIDSSNFEYILPNTYKTLSGILRKITMNNSNNLILPPMIKLDYLTTKPEDVIIIEETINISEIEIPLLEIPNITTCLNNIYWAYYQTKRIKSDTNCKYSVPIVLYNDSKQLYTLKLKDIIK